MASNEIKSKDGHSILLVLLSLVGVGVAYITSIVVARLVGPEGFEDYAVAIASLALMTSFAEAGTGKYALKILPAYVAAQQWSLAAGYWRYSLRTVLVVSVAIAAVVASAEGWENKQFGDYPLGIAVLFLPAAALSGAGVDFVMANRAAIRGALIARILVPVSTLLLLLWFANAFEQMNASWAVACYGSGAAIGAAAAAVVFWRTAPKQLFTRSPTYERPDWMRECVAFLLLAMLVTWVFRISIVILESLPVAESEVAWFAAAMETGCLILLVAKSTDKYFQPYISIIIEREVWGQGIRLQRRRHIWIGSVCLAFLLVIIVFGKPILRLFGQPFEAGYPALCLITVGSCTWTMFSLAPAYLKFVGKDRFVFGTIIGGALTMAGLTAILGYWWGATGAGMAFCIVVCFVALTFFASAMRHLKDNLHAAEE